MNILLGVKTPSAQAVLQILHDARDQTVRFRAQGAAIAALDLSYRPESGDAPESAANPISVIMSLIMDAQGNSSVSVFAPKADLGAQTDHGDDTITADVRRATVKSGAGNDVVSIRASHGGWDAVDRVDVGTGDDRLLIAAKGDVDRTSGGAGNDFMAISSQASIDRTEGGAGRDQMMLATAGMVDRASGGAGDDTMTIEAGGTVSRVDGGDGDDTVSVVAAKTYGIDGGDGNDSIVISAGQVYGADGGVGDDTIRISAGAIERVRGGKGDDLIQLDSVAGKASTLFFAEGDGNDVVETNAALVIRRTSDDGTRRLDASSASITHNDDGSLTIGFDGSNDTVTVRLTGDMAGRAVSVEAVDGTLVLRGGNGASA